MAEGFAGILYPPKCFDNLDDELPGIRKCLYDDDLYLRVIGIHNKIPVTLVNGSYGIDYWGVDIPSAQEFNLAQHNNAPMQYRADVTRLMNDELIKGFSL